MSALHPRGISAAFAIALVGSMAGVASAQSAPFDPAIDVQTFEYAIGPKTFFTVSNADVADKNQLAVDATVNYLTDPFTIYNVDPADPNAVGSERTKVVDYVAAMQITAAYGVTDKLQLGVNLPIIFSLHGEGLMASTGNSDPNGLNVTGLGDMLLEGKYRLYRKGSLKLGGIAGVSIPTSFGSDGSKFIGDNLPTGRLKLAFQYDIGKVSLGLNGGAIFRKPRTVYDSTVGQQLAWGAAAAVRITDRFSIVGEAYGRAGLPDFSLDSSPLSAEGGLRVYATQSVAVVIGGGAGLVKGIGSPASQFFLSVGYSPDVRDSDGDGVPNAVDKCPLIPEDRDGFQDDDGCPDDDSDGDRRADSEDKCPTQPEDLDGFDDEDGCPDPDNDGDHILDGVDKCPNDAEDGKMPYPNDGCPAAKRDSDGDGVNDAADACPTEEEDMDGFEDADGCPELDNDQDGVPDAQDKCPLCPEDKDGFEDGDGCPDLDNDHDGVPDAQDKCPTEPETINGVKDDDGCPDTGGKNVARLDGDRLEIDVLPTLSGNALSPAGTVIVDQVALVMLSHPEVTKWLVAVGLPKQADAQKLGDAVKKRLAAKGVVESTLNVLGAAGPQKIGGVVQERAEADAVPACPAGKEVKQRPEAAAVNPQKQNAPANAPTPAPTKPAQPDKPAEPEIDMDN
ncbi:MAG TPA: transporter [Kofleriaceae bacterium]